MERLITVDLDARQILNQMTGLDLAKALADNLSLTRHRLRLHTGRDQQPSALEDRLIDFIEGEHEWLAARDVTLTNVHDD